MSSSRHPFVDQVESIIYTNTTVFDIQRNALNRCEQIFNQYSLTNSQSVSFYSGHTSMFPKGILVKAIKSDIQRIQNKQQEQKTKTDEKCNFSSPSFDRVVTGSFPLSLILEHLDFLCLQCQHANFHDVHRLHRFSFQERK